MNNSIFVKSNSLESLPASHEDKNNPGVLKKVLFDAGVKVSGNLQMVNLANMPAGKKFNLHYHEDMTEVFILTSGKAKMKVKDSVYEMEKGDAVLVPPMHEHQMENLTEEVVEYLVFGISEGKGGKTVNI